MWIAGVMQGLMWRATEVDGSLTYSFVESVKSTAPFYFIRLLGGLLYLSGMLLMAYNVFKTVVGQTAVNPVVPGAAASTPQLSSLAQA
jgi:cytochrome c oxidase cbb3-type subunit 1